eukprot:TRINITY_DN11744_c0_g1_i3.p1 TRINITY_DN11744_c0_g1~~TRINITY_DN11744_c0_g1_i3.p1  ORF type:complete len:273 (+),score=33.06 TRINITY_DN11744_c0_g1_i3:125-943(+)
MSESAASSAFSPPARGPMEMAAASRGMKLADVLSCLEDLLMLTTSAAGAREMVRALKQEAPLASVVGLSPDTWKHIQRDIMRKYDVETKHAAERAVDVDDDCEPEEDAVAAFLRPRPRRIPADSDRNPTPRPSLLFALQTKAGLHTTANEHKEGSVSPLEALSPLRRPSPADATRSPQRPFRTPAVCAVDLKRLLPSVSPKARPASPTSNRTVINFFTGDLIPPNFESDRPDELLVHASPPSPRRHRTASAPRHTCGRPSRMVQPAPRQFSD